MKKISYIVILIVVSLMTIPTLYSEGATDDIDQQQTAYDASTCLHGEMLFAQSFKPSRETVTRVQLLMNKMGNLFGTTTLSIRKSLSMEDLTSDSIESIDMPSELEWVEFDFLDISVTPGDTYYIIVKPDPDSDGGDEFTFISWAFAINDLYSKGIPICKYQGSWSEGIPGHSSADYTFKIFGLDEHAEEMVEITITAGNLNQDIGRGVAIDAFNFKSDPITINYSITRDRYFVKDLPSTYESNFSCPAESSWGAIIGIGNEFIIYNLKISAWYEDYIVERNGIAIGELVILI